MLLHFSQGLTIEYADRHSMHLRNRHRFEILAVSYSPVKGHPVIAAVCYTGQPNCVIPGGRDASESQSVRGMRPRDVTAPRSKPSAYMAMQGPHVPSVYASCNDWFVYN